MSQGANSRHERQAGARKRQGEAVSRPAKKSKTQHPPPAPPPAPSGAEPRTIDLIRLERNMEMQREQAASAPRQQGPYRLIDLTEDPDTQPTQFNSNNVSFNNSRGPDDDLQLIGQRNGARRTLPNGSLNMPFIVLDLLMNGGGAPKAPQPPPVDISGGYWSRRRKGQLTAEEAEAAETNEKGEKAAKATTDGAFPTKDCPICLSPITEITAAICGHVFCEPCVLQAIHHQGKCPKCRRKLTEKDIHPLFF